MSASVMAMTPASGTHSTPCARELVAVPAESLVWVWKCARKERSVFNVVTHTRNNLLRTSAQQRHTYSAA